MKVLVLFASSPRLESEGRCPRATAVGPCGGVGSHPAGRQAMQPRRCSGQLPPVRTSAARPPGRAVRKPRRPPHGASAVGDLTRGPSGGSKHDGSIEGHGSPARSPRQPGRHVATSCLERCGRLPTRLRARVAEPCSGARRGVAPNREPRPWAFHPSSSASRWWPFRDQLAGAVGNATCAGPYVKTHEP